MTNQRARLTLSTVLVYTKTKLSSNTPHRRSTSFFRNLPPLFLDVTRFHNSQYLNSQEIRRRSRNSFCSEERGGSGSSSHEMCLFKSSAGQPHSRNEGSLAPETITLFGPYTNLTEENPQNPDKESQNWIIHRDK